MLQETLTSTDSVKKKKERQNSIKLFILFMIDFMGYLAPEWKMSHPPDSKPLRVIIEFSYSVISAKKEERKGEKLKNVYQT